MPQPFDSTALEQAIGLRPRAAGEPMAPDQSVAAIVQRLLRGPRERRVEIIGRWALEVLATFESRTEAEILLAASILDLYTSGRGDLTRDRLRLVAPKSHRTISRVWQELISDEGNQPATVVESSINEKET